MNDPGLTARPLRSLILFVALAYGLTWSTWGYAVLFFPDETRLELMILGGLGPMVAAALVSAIEGGKTEVLRLFKQLTVRPSLRLIAFWLALIAVLRLVPILLVVISGHGTAPVGMETFLSLPFTFLFVALVGGGLDEEVGWRGFAQPRLQMLVPALPASLIIGLVWSLWHWPLWLFPGAVHSQLSLPIYIVSTMALSVLFAYIFNSTRGGLLAVVLVHAASNTADNLRYAFTGAWNDAALMLPLQLVLALTMVAAAAVVVLAARGRRRPESQPQAA